MSYLTPSIGVRFATARRDMEDAWESWSRFLDTADREHVKDAAHILESFDARMRDLQSELTHESRMPTEEEAADDEDL